MSRAGAPVTTGYEEPPGFVTDHDVYLFKEGTHPNHKLGAHVVA